MTQRLQRKSYRGRGEEPMNTGKAAETIGGVGRDDDLNWNKGIRP